MVLEGTCHFYANQSMVIREHSVYLIPMADYLAVSASQAIDSYSDRANGGILQPQLHGKRHQIEDKLS